MANKPPIFEIIPELKTLTLEQAQLVKKILNFGFHEYADKGYASDDNEDDLFNSLPDLDYYNQP